jgi:hypothetical protein
MRALPTVFAILPKEWASRGLFGVEVHVVEQVVSLGAEWTPYRSVT